jgi:type IV pilus assembly protein PilA
VAEGWESGDVTGVDAAATAWNGGFAPTKYVKTVAVSVDGLGTISVTFDTAASGIPALATGKLITLSPNINKAPLAAGVTGPIDWACSSISASTAGAEGLTVNTPGTVLAKYVPTQCK